MYKNIYRPKQNTKPRPKVNYQIKVSPIRLIDQDGKNIGEVDIEKAYRLAQDAGLDLIEIAPTSKPPVCRIMDYGKYQYQQSQKEKDQKHKQKRIEVKSVRISPRIGQHDLEFKAKQSEKFLNHGDKVRIEIRMRGREKAHQEVAFDKLKQFLDLITIDTTVEQPPKREPRGVTVIIAKDLKKNNDKT